jgi:phage protein D
VLLTLEEKTVSWPNQADSDIVQQIVSDYGFNVQAEDTSPVHTDDETTIVQRGSDAQFIRGLARRNGYEFYFRKDADSGDVGCYFGPPRLGGSPQPDLAVQFGDDSNLSYFEVEMSGLRPLAVNVQQVDPHDQTASSGDASQSDLDSLGASGLSDLISDKLNALITPAQQQGQMLLLAQPTADQSELDAVAQAVRDQADWFIKARGEINGAAYGAVLRAGRLVIVKGAGAQFSGKYYVTRVRHVLKNDGSYKQAFDARRNARDLGGSEQFGGGLASSLGVPF